MITPAYPADAASATIRRGLPERLCGEGKSTTNARKDSAGSKRRHKRTQPHSGRERLRDYRLHLIQGTRFTISGHSSWGPFHAAGIRRGRRRDVDDVVLGWGHPNRWACLNNVAHDGVGSRG